MPAPLSAPASNEVVALKESGTPLAWDARSRPGWCGRPDVPEGRTAALNTRPPSLRPSLTTC